jgi:hypothetical protein
LAEHLRSDDQEQQARIAVLEYYASEMQGYKLNLLTLAVGLLGLIELWSRVYCSLPWQPVWAVAFGSFIGAMFYCLVRIAWFGAFVDRAYSAPRISGSWPMLNSVRRGIEQNLREYLSARPQTWGEKFWKIMIRCGQSASAPVVPGMIVSFIVAGLVWYGFPSGLCN